MKTVSPVVAATLVALAWTNGVAGREYHVAPAGCDAGEGTAEQPFLTLQRAAAAVQPGDTCVVHEGTYRETVRPVRSGTPEAPIRFVVAPGEKALITGTEVVSGWSAHEGRICKAAVSEPVEQLFCDRRIMVPAQFPNAGDDPYKPNLVEIVGGPGQCTSAALRRPKDFWKGATLWALGQHACVSSTATVAGSEGDAISFDGKGPFRKEAPVRIRLSGLLSLLDAPREWHQEGETVYFWPPGDDPPHWPEIEVTRRRWAFDLSERAYIEIKGFELFAASVNFDAAEHCTLDGCRVRYPSFDRNMKCGFNRDRGISAAAEGLGIALGGRHNAVRNSVVAYCIGDGVSVYAENNTVENCVIHDCDLSASDCAPIACAGREHVLRHNTLFNAGRSLLLHRHLKQGRIEHNHLYNAGLLVGDLGATYCFQTDGEGTVIAYNHAHDVHCHTGVGIYIDNGSSNHLIHHNLVHDVQDCGLRLNLPATNVRIFNNTLTGNGKGIASWGRSGAGRKNTAIVNNIITESALLGKDTEAHHNFLEKEPGFVDQAKKQFELKPDSPCVDAGIDVEGVAAGHAGRTPDIGCFEHARAPWPCGSALPKPLWDFREKW
ncbi:MAG: right-handed parallel beta-helix repeat-containing protein [Thermoguttaceae bacterium]